MCVDVFNHQRLLKMDSWISSLEKEIDDVDKDITESVPNLNLVRIVMWTLCSSPGRVGRDYKFIACSLVCCGTICAYHR